jgi:hypothetical protein
MFATAISAVALVFPEALPDETPVVSLELTAVSNSSPVGMNETGEGV